MSSKVLPSSHYTQDNSIPCKGDKGANICYDVHVLWLDPLTLIELHKEGRIVFLDCKPIHHIHER